MNARHGWTERRGCTLADRVGVRHSPALRFPAVRGQEQRCRSGPGLETRAHYPPVKINTFLVGKPGSAGFNDAADRKSIVANGPRDMPRVAVGIRPMFQPGASCHTLALARIDDDRKILHRSLHQFLRTVSCGGVKE
jgi:hypothetical protein